MPGQANHASNTVPALSRKRNTFSTGTVQDAKLLYRWVYSSRPLSSANSPQQSTIGDLTSAPFPYNPVARSKFPRGKMSSHDLGLGCCSIDMAGQTNRVPWQRWHVAHFTQAADATGGRPWLSPVLTRREGFSSAKPKPHFS